MAHAFAPGAAHYEELGHVHDGGIAAQARALRGEGKAGGAGVGPDQERVLSDGGSELLQRSRVEASVAAR
jgi:hypothetical protein